MWIRIVVFFGLIAVLQSCATTRLHWKVKKSLKQGGDYSRIGGRNIDIPFVLRPKALKRYAKRKELVIKSYGRRNRYVFGGRDNLVTNFKFVTKAEHSAQLAYQAKVAAEEKRRREEAARRRREAARRREEALARQRAEEAARARAEAARIKREIAAGTFTGNTSANYNGGLYSGRWVNGKPQGQGKLTFSDGSWYEGSWKNGEYHGEGVYRTSGGYRYYGRWENGYKDGWFTVRKFTILFGDSYRAEVLYSNGIETHRNVEVGSSSGGSSNDDDYYATEGVEYEVLSSTVDLDNVFFFHKSKDGAGIITNNHECEESYSCRVDTQYGPYTYDSYEDNGFPFSDKHYPITLHVSFKCCSGLCKDKYVSFSVKIYSRERSVWMELQ